MHIPCFATLAVLRRRVEENREEANKDRILRDLLLQKRGGDENVSGKSRWENKCA